MNFENTAIMAGVSGATLFWNQLKGFFSRITSVVIVKTTLVGDAEHAIQAYLWKHFRVSRLGERRFGGIDVFIKPMNRQGKVAFEMTGKSLTFFRGWRPIFIGNFADDKQNNAGNGLSISYIRGTYDIETLLVEATKEYDEQQHGLNQTDTRYCVRKFFGTAAERDRGNGVDSGSPKSTQRGEEPGYKSTGLHPSQRPLSWTTDQLGTPTSTIPFNNLAYGPEVKEFEKEIRRWKNSEKWFKSKGLPWRFGGGCYGGPGTGKTSFVRAIGQSLDLPIHVYDLTTMSNEELVHFWSTSLSCAPCIVLFEDIDRIFDKDKNIKTSPNKSPLTLDCLLNCINGVQNADGILTLVTANDMTKLDPALGIMTKDGKSSRPGRLDRSVMFSNLTEEGRLHVANRILSGFEHLIADVVKAGEDETGAQFESRCAKLALELYWNSDMNTNTEDLMVREMEAV